MYFSGVGVAQETGTTCVVSEEASMLFTERIALTDVENKRVSSQIDETAFVHELHMKSAANPSLH